LEQFGYLNISEEDISSATKRKLRVIKSIKDLATKPGYCKKEIPIQTISWDTGKAGFCEIDLVAHCGGSLLGDLIYTLQFVDIKTTWTERVGVMESLSTKSLKESGGCTTPFSLFRFLEWIRITEENSLMPIFSNTARKIIFPLPEADHT
jgi:hypothetical protein